MERVEVAWRNGVLSAIVRVGPSPIVLLHGLCGGAVHYEALFDEPHLAERGLIAIDLPGFGASNAFGVDDVGMDAQEEACRRVIAALGVPHENPWLVAHSMSGTVAGRLLDLVAGVVLLEGNLSSDHLAFSDRLLAIAEADFAAEYARIQARAPIMLRMQMTITDRQRLERCAQTYRACRADVVRRVAQETNREARSGRTEEAFGKWRGPRFYYFGEASELDRADGQYCRTGMATRVIDRAGHFLMLDAPRALSRLLASDAKVVRDEPA